MENESLFIRIVCTLDEFLIICTMWAMPYMGAAYLFLQIPAESELWKKIVAIVFGWGIGRFIHGYFQINDRQG